MRILLPLLFLLECHSALAQNLRSDTTFLATSVRNAVNVYTNALKGQSNLYNGTGYPNYQALQPGEHPYFLVDDWSNASIRYDGEDYPNILLMYDLFRDRVVLEHYSKHDLMELIDLKVERFSILGHTFIHLLQDKKNNIAEGYYDSLYNGKTNVYAKYDKSRQKAVKQKAVSYFFSERARYYIDKRGTYFPVYTRSSVLEVFLDHKKEVKQFLNKSKIGFKQNRGKAIAQMAKFYDTLTP